MKNRCLAINVVQFVYAWAYVVVGVSSIECQLLGESDHLGHLYSILTKQSLSSTQVDMYFFSAWSQDSGRDIQLR